MSRFRPDPAEIDRLLAEERVRRQVARSKPRHAEPGEGPRPAPKGNKGGRPRKPRSPDEERREKLLSAFSIVREKKRRQAEINAARPPQGTGKRRMLENMTREVLERARK